MEGYKQTLYTPSVKIYQMRFVVKTHKYYRSTEEEKWKLCLFQLTDSVKLLKWKAVIVFKKRNIVIFQNLYTKKG